MESDLGGPVRRRWPVTAQARAAAKSTRLVESEGGPLLVLPGALLPRWDGIEGDDYERACDAGDLRGLRVGAGKAVVLGSPDLTGLLARDREVLVIRQLGADQRVDVFAAALGEAQAAKWRATRVTLRVGRGDALWIIDSAQDGVPLAGRKTAPPSAARVAVPPGDYTLDTAGEFDAEAVDGARVGPVLFELHRLRRR